jgi:hypothetical protein
MLNASDVAVLANVYITASLSLTEWATGVSFR